jgi:hypothetical protein
VSQPLGLDGVVDWGQGGSRRVRVGKRRTVGQGSDRDEVGAHLHDVHCKCFKSEFVFPFLFRFMVADEQP